jgi:hypothetical protein
MKILRKSTYMMLLLAWLSGPAHCLAADQSKDHWIYVSDNALDAKPLDQAGERAWYATYDPAKKEYTYNRSFDDDGSYQTSPGLTKIDQKSLRTFWTQGEKLHVAYVEAVPRGTDCVDKKEKIVIDEQPRKSALEAGWATLRGILANIVTGDEAVPKVFCVSEKSKLLGETRAMIDIAFDKDSKKKAELSVITGPQEHIFLSADVLTKGASQLKFDSQTGTVTEKDKPSAIYLGLNWMLGDVYSRNPNLLTRERIVVKADLLMSKSPFDSYGVGLGYRLHDFGDPTATGGFMVFVASMWTKADDGGQAAGGAKRKQSWRIGVAYGLDSALSWLKK